jgi:outer membrane protein insertion porin family
VRLSSSEGDDNAVERRQEITFGPGSSLQPAVVRVEQLPDVVAGITVFRIVKGVLFADAGNTFAERAGLSISDLEVGVGFGLRITTPLAPVRIDVGYPVPGRPGLASPRWHFSIGQMF